MKINKNLLKYSVNGLFATLMHYLALIILIEFFKIKYIGIGNIFASIVGIIFSFFGNKYLVFHMNSNRRQTIKKFVEFSASYIVIAIIGAAIFFLLTDIFRFNYHYGFFLIIIIQFILGYLTSSNLIFKNNG